MKKKLLLLVMLVAVLTTVSAQKKWNYTIGFGGELKSGNINSVTVTHNAGVERNDSILSFSGDYLYVYGEKDHDMYDRGLNANLKFDLWQYNRLSPFVAANLIINRFKGYEYKLSFLAGAKFDIYRVQDVCDYSMSAAYVYDHVVYTMDDPKLKPDVSRLSLRFKGKQKLGEVVTLKHTTFYQPSVMSAHDFAHDFIFTSVTTFENRIGKNLFLDLNFSYEYRSIVPDDKKNYDILTSANLRFKF